MPPEMAKDSCHLRTTRLRKRGGQEPALPPGTSSDRFSVQEKGPAPKRTGPRDDWLWALGPSREPRVESPEPQKSNVTLNRTKRGDNSVCGLNHVGPVPTKPS